jgi:hypothetical protein
MILDSTYRGDGLLFLVGAPRSGTTWLQRLMATHPAVRTGQESHLFDFYIGPQLHRWRQAVADAPQARGGVGIGCYVTYEDFMEITRQLLIAMLQPMLADVDTGGVFLEKTPAHALYLREVHEFLPEARIIHLVRDPRDVTASLIAASRGWGSRWAPSRAAEAAALWAHHIDAVRSVSPELTPGRFLEITYEELHRSTEDVLIDVAAFAGLQWTREEAREAVASNSVESARRGTGTPIPLSGVFGRSSASVEEPPGFVRRGTPGGGREELSSWQRAVVGIVAGHQMEALGYARSSGRFALRVRSALRRVISPRRADP